MKEFVCLTRLYIRAGLFVLLSILYFIASTALCAAQSSTVDEETANWIIAASAFESDMNQDSAAELIPHYILENIPISSMRKVTSGEQYRRAKKSTIIELQELYRNLQAKTAERDSLVLTMAAGNVLTDAIELKELEILEIHRQIEEKKEEDSSLLETDFFPVEEQIVLWNNDPSKLYTLPEKISSQGLTDIHALITGSIQRIDSFIHVKVALVLYPDAVIVEEVVEIDNIISIEELSARIASKLNVAIMNVQPVTVTFNIEPPEAVSNAVIRINGSVLPPNTMSSSALFDSDGEPIESSDWFAVTILPSGIYSLRIESPGYRSVSTTYNFIEETEFYVQVNLEQASGTLVNIASPTAKGNMYVNALLAQQEDTSDASDSVIQPTGTSGSIVINNFPALGEFIDENGIATWFLLTETQGLDISDLSFPAEFSFVPDAIDFSERIEKNRKKMYNSWSALIVSLPLSFIANGQYNNEYNSWVSGNNNDGEHVKSWNMVRYATMGISIGLGINWVVQLILYLHSVNDVLPEELEVLNN